MAQNGIPGARNTSSQALIDDTYKRLSYMVEVIRSRKGQPHIRQLLSTIIRALPARSWLYELQTIFDYVKARVRYTRDPYRLEAIYDPEQTLIQGIGDCDDMAVVVGILAQSIGFPIKLRLVAQSPKGFSHIYTMALVMTPENIPAWVAMDTVYGTKIGEEPPYVEKLDTIVAP